MAGYSGKPLARKLGIKPGSRVALLGVPRRLDTELEPLPEGARLLRGARSPVDVIVGLATNEGVLADRLARGIDLLDADGGLWIGWPKKSSGVATDLAFDVVQSAGLAAGLVDNKVCAIDETWSGLRFVYRLDDRPAIRRRLAGD